MTAGADAHQGLLVSGRFAELEDALCGRVRALKRGRPLAPLTVVVGSAAARTRVGDVLVRTLGAVANVSVVTLARCAADLVAAERGAPPALLAGLARERLVRRLVAAEAGRLRYFGPVVDRPHFAQALAATFADLREARVAPETPWAEIVATSGAAGPATGVAGDSGGARAKAADLDRLYRAYCAELDSLRLLDAAGLQVAAAQAVQGQNAPAGGSPLGGGHAMRKLTLFGIYDLNQAQEALVAALIGAGADVLVPVPRGAARDGVTALAAAQAAGLREERLDAPECERDLCRLAAVWIAGRDGAVPSPDLRGDGSVEVISVADERAEAREAVREVLSAAATGASFRDCAIVVPRSDDVERVAAALKAADVPAACMLPDRAVGTRIALALTHCLAPAAGEPFARRAVVDLLTAAPLQGGDAAPGEPALWLDEARRAGVVGGIGQWRERVRRRRRGLEQRLRELEARSPLPESDDDETAEKVETTRLRLRGARGLEAAVTALSRACAGLPSRAPWSTWAEVFATIARGVFEPVVGDAAADAAGRLRALQIAGEEVDVAEAAVTLRDMLADSRVPTGRVGRDGVAVLTPLQMRGLSFHTVVFTGLAEGGFPASGRPDPILGDGERRRLTEATGRRLPLGEGREAESLLLFGFACEAARERLALLAPRTDAASGRPRLPSRLLLRLASLVAGHPVALEEFLRGAPLAPVWRTGRAPVAGVPPTEGVVWLDRRERDTAALLALSERGRRTAARRYLSDVLGDPDAATRRLGAWRAARSPEPGAWDGLLGTEARAALAARHPFDAEMHPTRLERYVGCPFSFYVRDVLGLDAPDEPVDALEMDAREFGTLVHGILQRAYEAVIAEDLSVDGALVAVDSAWATCCAEAERRGVTGAALSWEVRREMLRDDLLESVRRDPVFGGGGDRPVGAEWRFGESAGLPVILSLPDGRQVRFAGRLDRIDMTASGARVIDYKTGAGGVEKARINDGLSVQLPVYQLAVREAGDRLWPHGTQAPGSITCLYRLVTRRGGFQDLELTDDEESAAARLRALVSAAVALMDDGMFPRTTRGRCDYCDVRYACGVSAWARDRLREQPALEAVVRLQGPQPCGKDDDG